MPLTLSLNTAAKHVQFVLSRDGVMLCAQTWLTRNDGMALGLFAGNRAAGMLLPLAVIFCGWLLLRRYRLTPFTQTACGLVLGGFLGNFLERLWHGWVLDMIYFPFLPWFVCNVADIAICAGVALLAGSLLFRPQDWKEA